MPPGGGRAQSPGCCGVAEGCWHRAYPNGPFFFLLRPPAAYLSRNAMARRTRSSRAWHFVLSGVRHEADSRAVALASGARGWGYDSDGQVGGCWGRSTARQGELPSPSIPTPKGCVSGQLVL